MLSRPSMHARRLLPLLLLPAAAAAQGACDRRLSPGEDIQAALDALPADGRRRTVCLAAGEFPLARMLVIGRDHTTLRGSGPQTVLRQRDGVAEPLIVLGELQEEPARPIRGVTLERLRLVGGQADREFTAQRPYLSNSAVVVRRGENIRLRRLGVSSCRSACLLTERGTRGVRIERNEISGADWDGVSFNRTADVTMIDNDVYGNAAAGITAEHLTDSVIRDNRIARNGSHGVYLSDSRRNRFAGNRILDNRQAGIFLTCAVRFREPQPVLCWDNSMSQDNVFEDNVLRGNAYGYAVGADRAANCAGADSLPNLWRDNRSDAPNLDPQPEVFGYCLRPS